MPFLPETPKSEAGRGHQSPWSWARGYSKVVPWAVTPLPWPSALTTEEKGGVEPQCQVAAVKENGPLGGGRLCGQCPVRHRRSPCWAALQVGTWCSRIWKRAEPRSPYSQAGYHCISQVGMGTEERGSERSQSHRGGTRHLLNSDGCR